MVSNPTTLDFRRITHEVGDERLTALQRRVERYESPPVEAHPIDGPRNELLDGVAHSCGDDELVGLRMLDHLPHRANLIARISPVSSGMKIPEQQLTFEPERNRGRTVCDLPRQELEWPPLRFVVVKDRGAREQACR